MLHNIILQFLFLASTSTPVPVQTSGGGSGGSYGFVGITFQPVVTTTSLAVSTSGGQVLGASTTRNFTRNLTRGSRGDDVKKLQNHLLVDGVYSYAVTGYFGPITQKSLRSFQSKNKLPSTGFFGPMTRALLNK